MDFELFFQEYLVHEKYLKEKISFVQKLQRNIRKKMAKGELVSALKDTDELRKSNDELNLIVRNLKAFLSSFDINDYFENGDFALNFLETCKEQEVDIVGEFPNFEMFPYKVRVDLETKDIFLDRKKFSTVRASSFVSMVKTSQEKLKKASFNAVRFAGELANAYDLSNLRLKKKFDGDVLLQTVYKYLVPMSRFKKDYNRQAFAYDIARLYMAEDFKLKDGRSFQFGTSRENRKALRILDQNQHEKFLGTIRFY